MAFTDDQYEYGHFYAVKYLAQIVEKAADGVSVMTEFDTYCAHFFAKCDWKSGQMAECDRMRAFVIKDMCRKLLGDEMFLEGVVGPAFRDAASKLRVPPIAYRGRFLMEAVWDD